MPGGLPREAHSVEAIPDADTVTRAEAARIIAVHIATVDRLIRRGVISRERNVRPVAGHHRCMGHYPPHRFFHRLWISARAGATSVACARVGLGGPGEPPRRCDARPGEVQMRGTRSV